MNIREKIEERERLFLSKYATLSTQSKGRKKIETKCDLRTDFQRDRDRIIHSKSFRRLKYKTQVFLITEGDHSRTRLTHTLEVAQIARTIARSLSLNEDLTEAIALGHDLGHTPFGHAGERALDALTFGGFKHNEQSLRVVEVLEKDGGLNLTEEVREGILCHTGSKSAGTLEGMIIPLADKIAYINHDIDDAIRSGELEKDKIPTEFTRVLGNSASERIDRMIWAIINESMDRPYIKMEKEIYDSMMLLREFMFLNVYKTEHARKKEEETKKIIGSLFELYIKNPSFMEGGREDEEISVRVKDYIAGMTDRFAMCEYEKYFGGI